MKSSASGRNAGNVTHNEKMQRECYERFLVLWEERGYSDKFEFLGGHTSARGKVRIRCKLCGHEFERIGSFAEIDSNLRCGYCWVHRDDETCAKRDYRLADHVVAEYESGQPIYKISAKYNIQERVISKMLHDAGVNCDANRPVYKKGRAKTYKAEIVAGYKRVTNDINNWRVSISGLFDISECLARLDKKEAKSISKLESREPVIATCKHCGKQYVFFPDMNRYGRKKPLTYCSNKCSRKESRTGNHNHRARQYGAEYERGITLRKVYQRDGGVCYLCGKRTDFKDAWTIGGYRVCGNTYPSIDHVIPISKGGSHTWENVRLACRQCNSLKGDSTPIGR